MTDLLRVLRRRLTFISATITSIILIIITSIAFASCENEIRSRNKTDLKNEVQEVVYQLQAIKSISMGWLADHEIKNDIVISISENGNSLLFHGAKQTISTREDLVKQAIDIAESKYHFIVKDRGIWFGDNELSHVEMKTAYKEHYMFTISIVDVSGSSYEVIVLKDLKRIDKQILRLATFFILLDIIGTILLCLFSWWFSGRAIEPLKESRRKQSEFIAAVSHELKAPLAVLQTNSSAMRYKDADQKEYLISSIESECQRMSRLVDDLLKLASMDAGNWSIELRKTDIVTIMVEVYEMFYDTVRSKGYPFHIMVTEEEIPYIVCDAERIKQVLIVLVNNALSYTTPQTEITLAVIRKRQWVQLEVIDHGPGLSEEQKKQVFDRFYRGDESRHNKEHYGIGLSVAYEIVQLHKGKIYIKDTAGGGCTFVIAFRIGYQ